MASGPEKAKDQCGDRCNTAKQDAQSRYQKLSNKRIPQYLTGGTKGQDMAHYQSILQLQRAPRDAIRRVRLCCTPLPPDSRSGRGLQINLSRREIDGDNDERR
jgi:hypothetical protein